MAACCKCGQKVDGRRGYHFSKDTPAPESLSFSLCRISYIPLGDKLVDESVFLIPISKVPAHIRDRLLSSLWIHLLLFILLFLTYHSLLMKCIVILTLRHYSYALLYLFTCSLFHPIIFISTATKTTRMTKVLLNQPSLLIK